MKPENRFTDFLNLIIRKNKLDLSVKEKFIFLSYENYLSNTNSENKFIIYEDWWRYKPEVIKSKVKSILKLSTRIYARQCTVKKINKPEADNFLHENHIYGTTNSKVKYGLFFNETLFGLATFASQRQFKDNSRSAEMLRFCTKNGYSVTGGLDKITQAYIKHYQPDTIMTYIDTDWGKGDAFIKLGFNKTGIKPPESFLVNTKTGKRTPEKYFSDFENRKSYIKVQNSGSIKMIKKIKQ